MLTEKKLSIYTKITITNLLIFFLFHFLYALIYSVDSQEKPNIKATASDTLHVYYVVDEKNLRRLNDVIRKRINEKSENSIIEYTVSFIDNTSYITDDIEYLLKEENSGSKKITSIQMSTRSIDTFKPVDDYVIQVLLNSNKSKEYLIYNYGIRYIITGKDRNWVILTQSEILERINIIIYKSYYIPVVIGILFWAVTIFIIHKLLYYIYPTNEGLVIAAFAFISSIPGIFIGYLIYIYLGYLFPDAVFQIGDQVQAYEELKNVRSQVLWGIGIAFIISLVASVLANLSTRGRQGKKDNPL